ncbi:MAG: putative addiction module component [Thermoanaerobaculia bacterium]|jgi:putative addiction module component (TIGR02574 family)|nr:putative addiction module component [Thermoanaerobaculia bacterium]
MTLTFEKIEAAAMDLSERERIHLAPQLARSVSHRTPAIEEAWRDEVERRIALQDAGEIEDIPAEALYRELRQR